MVDPEKMAEISDASPKAGLSPVLWEAYKKRFFEIVDNFGWEGENTISESDAQNNENGEISKEDNSINTAAQTKHMNDRKKVFCLKFAATVQQFLVSTPALSMGLRAKGFCLLVFEELFRRCMNSGDQFDPQWRWHSNSWEEAFVLSSQRLESDLMNKIVSEFLESGTGPVMEESENSRASKNCRQVESAATDKDLILTGEAQLQIKQWKLSQIGWSAVTCLFSSTSCPNIMSVQDFFRLERKHMSVLRRQIHESKCWTFRENLDYTDYNIHAFIIALTLKEIALARGPLSETEQWISFMDWLNPGKWFAPRGYRKRGQDLVFFWSLTLSPLVLPHLSEFHE